MIIGAWIPAHDASRLSLASTGFVPDASTRTRTSPAPALGLGTSFTSSTSGPPNRVATIARMRGFYCVPPSVPALPAALLPLPLAPLGVEPPALRRLGRLGGLPRAGWRHGPQDQQGQLGARVG